MIQSYPKELLTCVFIGGFATVPFTTVLTFVNPVLMTEGYFNSHQLMIFQTLITVIAIISFIPGGIIADKTSSKLVMKFACLFFIIFSTPILFVVDKGNLLWLVPALIILVIINEIFLSSSNVYLKNLFPMRYRYRGTSLGYCIGMSLFGGLTPIVENYLYQFTGKFYLISLWLVFIGLGTLLSMNFVNRKQKVTNIDISYQGINS